MINIKKTNNSISRTKKKFRKTDKNRLLLVAAFCLFAILQSGLRDLNNLPAGNDTSNYLYKYIEVSRIPLSTLVKNFSFYSTDYGERDLGFPIFMKLTQVIYEDFTFYMFLTAILFMVPFGMLIYKYVKSYLGIILSFLIYFALYTNIVNSFMRQAVSLGVILFGIRYIINSDWKKYFSLLAIAFIIHASAILAFPLYFLPKWGSTRKWIFLALAVSPFLMLYTSQIISYLVVGTVYERYAVDESLNPINFISYLLLSAALTFYFYKDIKDVPDSKLLISGVLGSTLLIPIVWIGGTAIRLSFYYSVFIIPMIAVILDYAKIGKSERKAAYILGIAFFIFFIFRH